MLNGSKKGYAINPSAELIKKVLNKDNIKIIVERKDVAYDIKT